jgi:hypothetical protein
MSKSSISRTAVVAYTLDVIIGAGAFILSFDTLTHLARMAGINPDLAPIWPIVVDGIIVAATVAIYALNGKPKMVIAYPWFLLMVGASVSTVGNSVHAILTADGSVPVWVSASIAAVPPLALLAITHLTSILLKELPATKHKTKRAATVKPDTAPDESSVRLWGDDAELTASVDSAFIPEPAPAVLV